MKLEKTPIKDLMILHRPIVRDSRGTFTRLFGEDDIAKAGRPTKIVHVNSSTSKKTGTLRGIHFQYPPFAEAKIVSCTAGSVWDVGVDLRPGSPTRFKWFGVELTPQNGVSLVIPEGFGHGFITLKPRSTIVYAISSIYRPDHEAGIRFDEQILNIAWPVSPNVVSDKDLSWPSLNDLDGEIIKRFGVCRET